MKFSLLTAFTAYSVGRLCVTAVAKSIKIAMAAGKQKALRYR